MSPARPKNEPSIVNIAETYSVARATLEEAHRATLRKRQYSIERTTQRRRLLLNCGLATGGIILFAVMYWR